LANDISVDSNRDVTLSNLRSDQPMMFRNRIINGDMRIAQRGTSFTNIGSTGVSNYDAYPADRFIYTNISSVAKISATNETTDVPSGFRNASKIQVTTADSNPAANHYANLYYAVEAQDIVDLQYGSSGAKNLTFSFYAKASSSAAGTYQYNFLNNNAGRMIARTFTVTDSWQKFIMYIPGDTDASGVIPNDTSAGFRIILQLDSGANQTGGTTPTNWSTANLADRGVGTDVSFLSNTSNEFYITGVQLEEGTVPTPFEHRPYGIELSLCQRYAIMFGNNTVDATVDGGHLALGWIDTIDNFAGMIFLPTTMRERPVLTASGTNNFEIAYTDLSVSTVSGKDISQIQHLTTKNLVFFSISSGQTNQHRQQPASFRYLANSITDDFLLESEI